MIQCNKVQCVTTLSINYYRATEMLSSTVYIILFHDYSKITPKNYIVQP